MLQKLAERTHVDGDATRDDRVLPVVRIVAALVVFILALAIWALYLHPDETEQGFAWTVKPRMMAMAIGAGYGMGAYFFVRVLRAARWHYVAAGFLPITAFTISMAALTAIHYDRFHQNQLPAQLWVIIYVITPLLVPFLWWLNQKTDPHTLESDDLVVPRLMRTAGWMLGVAITIFSLVVFIQPTLIIPIWPWTLTPLGARVVAGWALLPALGGLYLSREPRWSGWRILLQTLTVGIGLFVVAVFFAWSDWSFTSPLAVVYLLGLIGALFALPLIYVYFERQRKRHATLIASVSASEA